MIKKYKIGNKEYTLNSEENLAYDILFKLKQDFGSSYIRENKEKIMKKSSELISEILGDKGSESVHFKFFKIPENDRLRYYQLILRHLLFRINTEKKNDFSGIWNYIIEPIIIDGKIFDINEDLISVLSDTESTKTQMPFNQMILNCRIPIYDRIYYGIMVGKLFTDGGHTRGLVDEKVGNPFAHYTGLLSCYSQLDKTGERQIYTEWFDTENTLQQSKLDKYQKRLLSFLYSFCNLINEPEVKVVENPFNPKNNERREKRGSMPLPTNREIRIYGRLEKYVKNYNEGVARAGFSHKFVVRGHFRHLRNKKRYSQIYKLSDEELTSKGFQKSNDLVKKWLKPYVKGAGILVDKTYKVKLEPKKKSL